MGVIEKITDKGQTAHLIASTAYGTCDTAAATASKVVTLTNSAVFDDNYLITGVTIHVKFTNSNTHATPTLKVGTATAKDIKAYGTTKPGTSTTASWYAGSVVSFTYDGTYWQMNDFKMDTDTNTDTWRNVKVDGTEILGTATNTGALNLASGNGISLTNNSGTVTIDGTENTSVSGTTLEISSLNWANYNNRDLLWENDAPTSIFAEQTVVVLNMSDYEEIVIDYYGHIGQGSIYSVSTPTSTPSTTLCRMGYTTNIIYQRTYTINTADNEITFNAGRFYTQYNSGTWGGSENNECVPVRIWGWNPPHLT